MNTGRLLISAIFRLPGLVMAGVLMMSVAYAQTPAPAKELSEAVSGKLGELRTLTDVKDYTKALVLLDQLVATAPDPSFDLAIVSQVRGQVLIAQGRYAEALRALEKAYDLSERHGFFEARVQLETLYLLSQLNYQLAGENKDAARQKAGFEKAYAQVTEWLRRTPSPTMEARLFAASILYGQATAGAGAPDTALLQRAGREAEQGFYLQTKPSEQARFLVLATQQQLNENLAAAETLELLVEQVPASAQYWQQLAAIYFGLASEARSEAETRRYNLRALLTLERAQARGLLNGPKENFTVVGILFNLRQYDRAIDVLEKGLSAGTLENSRRNWEMLASAYQQQHRDELAVGALNRAVVAFPKDGQLEFTLGQLHYALDQTETARRHLESAVAKGNLERPGQTRFTLAYLAFEQHRFDEAAKWIEAAGKFPDVPADDVARLSRAVEEARATRVEAAAVKKIPSHT